MANRALTPQQQAELAFWADLVQRVGPEYYLAYRGAEYVEKTRHFPSFLAQKGTGLDFGCGCVSVFETSSKTVYAMDPLWAEYCELLGTIPVKLVYDGYPQDKQLDWLKHQYDWVACLNMIDHTPDPVFTLRQIWKILKPGGRLYFEVNFEEGLAAPHYMVWDEAVVARMFQYVRLDLKTAFIEKVPEHHQRRYWAEYVKFGGVNE